MKPFIIQELTEEEAEEYVKTLPKHDKDNPKCRCNMCYFTFNQTDEYDEEN